MRIAFQHDGTPAMSGLPVGTQALACPRASTTTRTSYLPDGDVKVELALPKGEITPSLLLNVKAVFTDATDTLECVPCAEAICWPPTRHWAGVVQSHAAAPATGSPPVGSTAALAPTHQLTVLPPNDTLTSRSVFTDSARALATRLMTSSAAPRNR